MKTKKITIRRLKAILTLLARQKGGLFRGLITLGRRYLGRLSSTMKQRFLLFDKRKKSIVKGGGLVLVSLIVVVLFYPMLNEVDLEDLKESGELVVISRESDTTWYEGRNGPEGPEYDYLTSLANYLNVELKFENKNNDQEVLEAIANGNGQLAATGITDNSWLRDQGIIFAPEYQLVDQQVVCRRGKGRAPRDLSALTKVDLVVVANSSQEAQLLSLKDEYPELHWESVADTTTDDLLEQVWQKKVGCTIANSNVVNIKRRLYPELVVGFTLQENQPLAWVLSPEWAFLSESVTAWLKSIDEDGTLLILKDRHFSKLKFDYVDLRSFIRRINSRLPKLAPLFKHAAAEHNMPWTLLAAQAYQESHWNRNAKSPTGVRGIMMLTRVTAKEVGVTSRLDVKQSVQGGAKYLKKLEARIPKSVTGDDRWWFALAAYNIGMGHVHDARKLTEKLGLDPNSWLDLKGVLPLLSKKKYYKGLKYGYARGGEPVAYVRRIRNYGNILRAQLARRQGIHAG